MAIYSERERALELEEQAKAGARGALPPERTEWKGIRREAAGIRRDIPPDVRSLRNEPDRQTGTGASSNPLRGPNNAEQTAMLGEPSGSVSDPTKEPGYSPRLGRGPATDAEMEAYHDEGRADWDKGVEEGSREDRWNQKRDADARAAAEGDEAAGRRVEMFDEWKQMYDRMDPREQVREDLRQDEFRFRQDQLDQYLTEHPEYRIHEDGSVYDGGGGAAEDRELNRLFRERDRASRQLDRGNRRPAGGNRRYRQYGR